jgi:hypothetical protein
VSGKQHTPAGAERNRDAIVELVGRALPGPTVVLEAGAGTGSHSAHYARALPWLTWVPTDVDPGRVDSIAAWRAEAGLPNLRAPLVLDVTSDPWDVPRFGAVVAVHLTCGAPWPVSVGLLNGAARELPAHGALITISEGGRWGDKTLAHAAEVAARRGLVLDEEVVIERDQIGAVFRRR